MSSRVFHEPDVISVQRTTGTTGEDEERNDVSYGVGNDVRYNVLSGLLHSRLPNKVLHSLKIPPFGDAVILELLRVNLKALYPDSVHFCKDVIESQVKLESRSTSSRSIFEHLMALHSSHVSEMETNVMVNLRLWPAQFTGSTPFYASFHPKSIDLSSKGSSPSRKRQDVTWLRFVSECFERCGAGASEGEGVLFTSLGVRMDNSMTFFEQYSAAKARHEARKELFRLRSIEFEVLRNMEKAHHTRAAHRNLGSENRTKHYMGDVDSITVGGMSHSSKLINEEFTPTVLFEKRSTILPKHIAGVDDHGFAFDILCVEKGIIANNRDSKFLDVTLPALKSALVNVFHVSTKGEEGARGTKQTEVDFQDDPISLRQRLLLPKSRRREYALNGVEVGLTKSVDVEDDVALQKVSEQSQSKGYSSDRVAYNRRLYTGGETTLTDRASPNDGPPKRLSTYVGTESRYSDSPHFRGDEGCGVEDWGDDEYPSSGLIQGKEWTVDMLNTKQRERMRSVLRRQARVGGAQKRSDVPLDAISEIVVPRRLITEEVSAGSPARRYCIPKVIADRARLMVFDSKSSATSSTQTVNTEEASQFQLNEAFTAFLRRCAASNKRIVDRIDAMPIIFITPDDLETLPPVMGLSDVLLSEPVPSKSLLDEEIQEGESTSPDVMGATDTQSPCRDSLLDVSPSNIEQHPSSSPPANREGLAFGLSDNFITNPTEADICRIDEFLHTNKKLAVSIAMTVGHFGFPAFVNPYNPVMSGSSSVPNIENGSQRVSKATLSLRESFPHVIVRSVSKESGDVGLSGYLHSLITRTYSYGEPRLLLQLMQTHRIVEHTASRGKNQMPRAPDVKSDRPFEFLSKSTSSFPYDSPSSSTSRNIPELSSVRSKTFKVIPLRPGESKGEKEGEVNATPTDNGRTVRITHPLPHALQQLLALQLAADHSVLRTIYIMEQSLKLSPEDTPPYCSFVLRELWAEQSAGSEGSSWMDHDNTTPAAHEASWLSEFRDHMHSVSNMPFADLIHSPYFNLFASFEEEERNRNALKNVGVNPSTVPITRDALLAAMSGELVPVSEKPAPPKPETLSTSYHGEAMSVYSTQATDGESSKLSSSAPRIKRAQEAFDVIEASAKEMFACFLLANPSVPIPAVEAIRNVLNGIEARAAGVVPTSVDDGSTADVGPKSGRDGQGRFLISCELHKKRLPYDPEFYADRGPLGHALWSKSELAHGFRKDTAPSEHTSHSIPQDGLPVSVPLLLDILEVNNDAFFSRGASGKRQGGNVTKVLEAEMAAMGGLYSLSRPTKVLSPSTLPKTGNGAVSTPPPTDGSPLLLETTILDRIDALRSNVINDNTISSSSGALKRVTRQLARENQMKKVVTAPTFQASKALFGNSGGVSENERHRNLALKRRVVHDPPSIPVTSMTSLESHFCPPDSHKLRVGFPTSTCDTTVLCPRGIRSTSPESTLAASLNLSPVRSVSPVNLSRHRPPASPASPSGSLRGTDFEELDTFQSGPHDDDGKGDTVASNAIPRLYRTLFERDQRQSQSQALFGYTHKNAKSMTPSRKLINLQTAAHPFQLAASPFKVDKSPIPQTNGDAVLDFSVVSARAYRGVQMLRTRQDTVDKRYLTFVEDDNEDDTADDEQEHLTPIDQRLVEPTNSESPPTHISTRGATQRAPTSDRPKGIMIALPMGLVTTRLGERLQLDGGSLGVGDIAASTTSAELYLIEGFRKVAKNPNTAVPERGSREDTFLQSNPHHASSPYILVAHCRRILRSGDPALDHLIRTTTDSSLHGIQYPNCSHFLRYENVWRRALAFANEMEFKSAPTEGQLTTSDSDHVTVIDFDESHVKGASSPGLTGMTQSMKDRVDVLYVTYKALHSQQGGSESDMPSQDRLLPLMELEAFFLVSIDEVFGTDKKGPTKVGGLERFFRFAALDGRTSRPDEIQQLVTTLKGFFKRLLMLLEPSSQIKGRTGYTVPVFDRSRALLSVSDFRSGQEVLACFAKQFLRPFLSFHISQQSAPFVHVAPSTSLLTDECCDVVAYALRPTSSTQSLLQLDYPTCRALRRLSTYYSHDGATNWGPIHWLNNWKGVPVQTVMPGGTHTAVDLLSLFDDNSQRSADRVVDVDLVSNFVDSLEDAPPEQSESGQLSYSSDRFVETRRRLCFTVLQDLWAPEQHHPALPGGRSHIVSSIPALQNVHGKSAKCGGCACPLTVELPQ